MRKTKRTHAPFGKRHYQQLSLGTEELKQRNVVEYLTSRYSRIGPLRKTKPIRSVKSYRKSQSKFWGKIVNGEALDFLRSIESDTASIVFLDPPFNLGKKYSDFRPTSDRLSESKYRTWMVDVLVECARILKPGGVLYLYHLPMWAMRLGSTLEGFLNFRQWIAISMKNGFAPPNRLYPAHYALLSFSKGTPATFRRPKLKPAKCRHCGEIVKDYGGYLPLILSKGINLSDVWDDLSPVRHAKYKFRSANELPKALFSRIFEMSGERGGLYVDPFGGGGSGVVAAVHYGMRFETCDIVVANCRLMRDRLRQHNTARTNQ
jgi:site-specific DNA-methyltransferase (adenine-specific)